MKHERTPRWYQSVSITNIYCKSLIHEIPWQVVRNRLFLLTWNMQKLGNSYSLKYQNKCDIPSQIMNMIKAIFYGIIVKTHCRRCPRNERNIRTQKITVALTLSKNCLSDTAETCLRYYIFPREKAENCTKPLGIF